LANIIQTIPLVDFSEEETAAAFSCVLPEVHLDEQLQSALFAETAGHPHLVAKLAEAFINHRGELTVEMIETTATDLALAWANEHSTADLCFRRAIRWVSRNRRAFEAVLALLAGSSQREPVPDWTIW
jgi:hypothetical protein